MSSYATGMVWKVSRAKGSPLLVLLAIADVADEGGRNAWPSPDNLAQRSRLTSRATRLILHQLERTGELDIEVNIERRQVKSGYVPPRFFHVRCVFDTDRYLRQESENFSETPFAVGRPAKGKTFPISAGENRKSFPGNRNASVRKSEKSCTAYKEDPSVDPLVELKAGGSAPDTRPDDPEKSLRVVTVLVHEVLDLQGDGLDDGDLREAVKGRLATLKIRVPSHVVNAAVDSARVQRRRRAVGGSGARA